MATIVNVKRLVIQPVFINVTGLGPSTILFLKSEEYSGEAVGVFQFSLFDVVGSFSSLQLNIEFSADGLTEWETVTSWQPLTAGIGLSSCAEAGFFRLNCTAFSGGSSFSVNAQIAPTASSTVSITGSIAADQGTPGPITTPWPVELSNGTTAVGTISNPLYISGNSAAAEPTYSVNTGSSLVAVTTGTAVLSIKPQIGSSKSFSLQDIDLSGDGSMVYFLLVRNLTLTGSNSFTNVGGTSQMQYNTTAGYTPNTGDVVDSGYYGIGAHIKVFSSVGFNSVSDTFTLILAGVNGRPANVGGAFRWTEQ